MDILPWRQMLSLEHRHFLTCTRRAAIPLLMDYRHVKSCPISRQASKVPGKVPHHQWMDSWSSSNNQRRVKLRNSDVSQQPFRLPAGAKDRARHKRGTVGMLSTGLMAPWSKDEAEQALTRHGRTYTDDLARLTHKSSATINSVWWKRKRRTAESIRLCSRNSSCVVSLA